MAAEPIRIARDASAPDPRAPLRLRLHELADALAGTPLPERADLRRQVHEAGEALQAAGGEHELVTLLLRNLLRDLAAPAGRLDAPYFARQLTLAADRVG